ncbi:MAG: HlyD family efflux transporter periplasmic adaptor subunit [Chitinophagaceae bacterium]|nr:HlyD family efflux transporter periplasmic adaptor subunit [Chitinophagaceae bacterium]MCW5929096.1 HlyD family efflux transporter periplasmic adaptor subunit [Chitinophagaceae bacterium]
MKTTTYKIIGSAILLVFIISCGTKIDYDGSGNFEADEVIVSAQQTGEILSFNISEGTRLQEGDTVGDIDIIIPELQKEQTEARIAALKERTTTPAIQVAVAQKQLRVQESRMAQLGRERDRTANLVKADAATQKQLDDINSSIDALEKEMQVTKEQIRLYTYNTHVQNRSVLSEQAPLEVAARQYQQQMDMGKIINPVTGIVLAKYALKGELATIGKPLYKIANVDTIDLKAYITGDKLSSVALGQPVTVRIDEGKKTYRTYPGTIVWIADKSEFTPKTIQTKNERANLVYAIKASVKNDGFLKIGMYGELILDNSAK